MAALEEERIRQIKHWTGFPIEVINFYLNHAGINIKDINYITISRNPLARFHKKVFRVLLKLPQILHQLKTL